MNHHDIQINYKTPNDNQSKKILQTQIQCVALATGDHWKAKNQTVQNLQLNPGGPSNRHESQWCLSSIVCCNNINAMSLNDII